MGGIRYISEGGAIVTPGSMTGLEGAGNCWSIPVHKGAFHAFTKSLQQPVDSRIRANRVSPGLIVTPSNLGNKDPEDVSKHGADTPPYVFFGSKVDSSYISGDVMPILGGDTVAGWERSKDALMGLVFKRGKFLSLKTRRAANFFDPGLLPAELVTGNGLCPLTRFQ